MDGWSGMEEKAMDDNILYFPPEIMRNILKRLPAKSILRFGCVCKAWRNLFNTQSFISDHLHHSRDRNHCLLFQRVEILSQFHFLDSEMKFREFRTSPPVYLACYTKILGSSNGLLCLRMGSAMSDSKSFYLANPSIGQIKRVPDIIIREYPYDCIKFGFCPSTNDHNILIASFVDRSVWVSGVNVFSLNSGSWKQIEFNPKDTARPVTGAVVANGVVFWFGSLVAAYSSDVIVSFDLAAEAFALVPPPEPRPFPILFVYEEKLAAFSDVRKSDDDDDGDFVRDLWVLEEGVVGVSGETERWGWTRKYISLPRRLIPMHILRNEVVCLEAWEVREIISLFNINTKNINEVAIGKTQYILDYAESILPVGGMASLPVTDSL